MHVLLLENISSVAVDLFRDAGYTVESLKAALDERELIEKIRGVSVLGVRSKTQVTAAVIEAACAGTRAAELRSAGRPSSGSRSRSCGTPRRASTRSACW